jgi:hypothetical protein
MPSDHTLPALLLAPLIAHSLHRLSMGGGEACSHVLRYHSACVVHAYRVVHAVELPPVRRVDARAELRVRIHTPRGRAVEGRVIRLPDAVAALPANTRERASEQGLQRLSGVLQSRELSRRWQAPQAMSVGTAREG